jgi:hypothetical protein
MLGESIPEKTGIIIIGVQVRATAQDIIGEGN